MTKLQTEYDLDIDYKMLLGKGWEGVLRHLLHSKYMKDLMMFLHGSYKLENVRPHKSNVFLPFKMTGFHTVRVVIISDEPYNNIKSTGIPYGNVDKWGELFSPELLKIHKTVERTCYDGFKMDIDPTLSGWGEQGVLSIPSTFTSVEGRKGAHEVYWKHFTREVIKTLNEYKPGTIYLLWGNKAKDLKKYIDMKTNYVFYAESPTEAVALNRDWNCDHFVNTNAILSYLNGEDTQIVW